MTNSEQHIMKTALSPNRLVLEGLTDGVFAIVMTLLVLGLSIPVFKGSSMHQELTQLLEMWPKFATYVVTFLMLGFMWYAHHRVFVLIKRSDSVLIWINIICLMFTSLLPFSTSLLAEYMGQQLPILIYEGNYLMCMLMGYANWSYATGKYRLVDTDIDSREVRRRKIIWLSGTVIVAISMGISYLNTIASMVVFVVFFISLMIYVTLRGRICTTEQVAE